jgi:hypothetical protein
MNGERDCIDASRRRASPTTPVFPNKKIGEISIGRIGSQFRSISDHPEIERRPITLLFNYFLRTKLCVERKKKFLRIISRLQLNF